jgi:hypothetical protein
VDRSSCRLPMPEFPVIDLCFQGLYSARLGANLSFYLLSISPFHSFSMALDIIVKMPMMCTKNKSCPSKVTNGALDHMVDY